jgi:predicted  nucleic acid-binding Zn-ribbon protein
MRRRKKKVIYKAERGSVSTGDFVAYAVPKPPQGTQYAKGKVESIKTSGSVKVRGTNESVMATEENPVAIVRVYRQTSGNKYVPTDRRVAKNISNLRKLKPLQTKMHMEKADSNSVTSRLNELVTQHNEKYGNVNSKKVTVSMLRQVYNRGIGAYRTNPGSVRPNVASAEQWAYARVNGFLHAVRTGRYKRKPFDTDLLPGGHPLSTKSNKGSKIKKFSEPNEEGGVEVAENIESPELDTADAEEVEFEVEESVEEVDEADEDLAKAVESEDVAVDTSEQIDLEKALGDVKEFIEEQLQKSVDSSKEGLTALSESITELVKSFDEKVGELSSKYEELTKGLADISKTQEEIASRVESVEEDTAMKKSGELENSIPEQPVMRKSLWGGRFLNSADI